MLVFTDPFDVDGMYRQVSASGNMLRWICKRGSSPLEGYHGHLGKLLHGANYSPDLADALVKLFNFRWSVAAGIRNAGDYDFGMYNFVLLLNIKRLCQKMQVDDPLPEFKVLARIENPEQHSVEVFGMNVPILGVPSFAGGAPATAAPKPVAIPKKAPCADPHIEVDDETLEQEAELATSHGHPSGM